MTTPQKRLATLAVTAVLAAAGCACYRVQLRQAATLARIIALETCLTASNRQRARAANNTLANLSEAVRKNHNQAAAVAVLRQAQQIKARTQALLDTLHQLRHEWQRAGPRVVRWQLPAQLPRYVAFLNRFVPDATLLPLPLTATETSGWLAEFDRASEPKPAALARLTRLETQMRQAEAAALTNQAMKVVYEGITYEPISALAVPTSASVAPGTVYQAQLLLVLAASSSSQRFSADGREVAVNPATGQGMVQFRVPAARPGQPDTVRTAWRGRVQLPWAAGDTTLEITVPYCIVKPRQR